jgi:two-component system OmpR family sensor kinase
MSKSVWHRLILALLPLFLGILIFFLIKVNLVENYVLLGYYQVNLSTFCFLISGFLSLYFVIIVLTRSKKESDQDRKIAHEREVQSLERQRFLHRLDHEMKNPLTTIRLGLTNLQDRQSNDPDETDTLNRIGHQAQRLQTLVEDLRRLADLNEASMEIENNSLAEILEEAVTQSRSLPGREQSTVQLTVQEVPWPLAPIRGDRDLLVLAFRNLIENALKFSESPGRVEVRATEDDHSILVEVADSGRGIPPEDLQYICTELYRGKNAQDQPGSGLGLAMVQHIVELHHGRLEINSRLGQGTVARVLLPIKVN